MELVRRDTDYAVRALIMIAREGGIAQAQRIAREEDVPFEFLHKILRKLKIAGIVDARRGAGGGFSLSRPASKIRLLGVIEAVQGRIAVNRCFLGEDICPRQKNCPARRQLAVVQKKLREILKGITLADLVGEKSQHKHKRRK